MTVLLARPDIERILPHRDPFLFVDKVVELVPGERVVGVFCTPDQGALLGGSAGPPNGRHYFPPTLLVEAMAQVGAILVLYADENRGRTIYFRSIEAAHFHQDVTAGVAIRIEGNVRRLRSRMGTLEMKALLDDAPETLLADGVMSFAL